MSTTDPALQMIVDKALEAACGVNPHWLELRRWSSEWRDWHAPPPREAESYRFTVPDAAYDSACRAVVASVLAVRGEQSDREGEIDLAVVNAAAAIHLAGTLATAQQT